MTYTEQKVLLVSHRSDEADIQEYARTIAHEIGFDEIISDEIALVSRELASNLVKHAGKGTIIITPLHDLERRGIQIQSIDTGPGIRDVERAIVDGFSTSDSLGYGLGTANRLMDELDITSEPGQGTQVICRRWIRVEQSASRQCPLEFGAATRAHPKMMGVNGDTFIIKQWNHCTLTGVIDGLGHGQWAQRASQTARRYIETHFDQPLVDIFRGVGRSCKPTRGVVMALALFNWEHDKLTFASIGNVETRVFNTSKPTRFIVRRGIVGMNAPAPTITEDDWDPSSILIMHSDGLSSHWHWEDYPGLAQKSANDIAYTLLHALAKDDDDATIVVVRSKLS
jgi:anti-sigma regulatory factor (Ser/Thr protein kinase)